MRYDSIGLFWQEVPQEKREKTIPTNRPLPPIPDTGWKAEEKFPDLSSAKVIAIDCETYDPDIMEKGPGVRRDGYIVGVSIGTNDGFKKYYPIRHYLGGNLDPTKVLNWLREQLGRPNQPKIGANILYDLDYLTYLGVHVEGPFYDVQVAEPLIDETRRSYSLESIAQEHLKEGKIQEQLYQWISDAYGVPAERNKAANYIWRAPVELVGPYAESDVDLPIRIFEIQKSILEKEGLYDLFILESKLIPILLKMRQFGVKVDVEKASRVSEDLERRAKETLLRIKHLAGFDINPNASDSISKACDKLGIAYPRTEKGKASFIAQWLSNHPSEFCRLIREVRRLEKINGTFIKSYILDGNINGRLHCNFNQLKSDEGGAISGRFSSSNPNLQNLPARDPELGPLTRSIFIPEDDCEWVSLDWSQIEYRLIVHNGEGQSAIKAQQQYNSDPKTDFHEMVAQMAGIDRRSAKDINFGISYGMGSRTLAANLNKTLQEAEALLEQYHGRLPFVKNLFNKVQREAAETGIVRTLLNRKAHFNTWEPAEFMQNPPIYKDYDLAVKKHGRVKRAFTHSTLNRVIQGSAADLMKLAMVKIHEAGLLNEVDLLLTVHDELDFSIGKDEASQIMIREAKQIMKHCYKLKVPMLVDDERGSNWGEGVKYE